MATPERVQRAEPLPGVAAAATGRPWWSRRAPLLWRAGLVAVIALAGAHAAAVAPRYHVGSFDDDGGYVALARALASGQGFVDTTKPGVPIETFRPPGYPALLAPLAALFPDSTLPFRFLSLAALLACFPLAWYWMGLRRVPEPVRLAVLVLFALNPVTATYATMVMAEAPFLVLLLVLLIAFHRWDRQDRAVTPAGLAATGALVGLLLLKTAGTVFAPAAVAYLLLRRRVRAAALLAAGTLAALVPLVVSRVLVGVSPLGGRNAQELSGYSEGPVRHLLSVLPGHIYAFCGQALPASVLPADAPVQAALGQPLLGLLTWAVAPLVVLGFWQHQRRGLDVTLALVPLYVLQSLAVPFINERRVILILPIVLLWFVLGVTVVWRGLAAGVRLAARRWPDAPVGGTAPAGAAALSVAVAAALLGPQFSRDYLFGPGVESSRPQGSAYLQVLGEVSAPDHTVTSSFWWTPSAFTGRPVVRGPFDSGPCPVSDPAAYEQRVRSQISRNDLAAVLVAALKWPDRMDDPCLLALLDRNPDWAVRVYRQPLDRASVFELVGPGTAHPRLSDATVGRPLVGSNPSLRSVPEQPLAVREPAGHYAVISAVDGAASLTVRFDRPVSVAQVSVGAAGQTHGDARSITVSLRTPAGSWQALARTRNADVQPPSPGAPEPPGPSHLMRRLSEPRRAVAVRVSFRGDGPFELHDLHVLAYPGDGA